MKPILWYGWIQDIHSDSAIDFGYQAGNPDGDYKLKLKYSIDTLRLVSLNFVRPIFATIISWHLKAEMMTISVIKGFRPYGIMNPRKQYMLHSMGTLICDTVPMSSRCQITDNLSLC